MILRIILHTIGIYDKLILNYNILFLPVENNVEAFHSEQEEIKFV